MKIRTRNILYILLPVVSLTLVNTSCKKDNNPTEQMRMFMPPGEIKATSAETSVTLTWSAALYQQSTDKSITYTVQVSKDSLFNTVERTYLTDTTGVIITQDSIPVRKKYYARIKTNGNEISPESKWLTSSSFKITGEQIFNALRDAEVKETSLTLRWIVTQGLTKLVFTPASGTPMEVAISAADISSGVKVVNGLKGGTAYEVEIFQGTKSKGYLAFTTTAATAYTVVITPADNLVTVIDTCSNNAVIGLQPGVYSAGSNNFVVKQKTITIKSVSGNTFDTKVNWKEFTLKGAGAGIKLQDIEFDGLASGGQYFLNLTGLNSDAEAATFTNIEVTNCVIHNMANCLLRGNRGTGAAGDHKIGNIKFRGCLVYDNLLVSAYTLFTLDKLQFALLDLSNSTFYNYGRDFIAAPTAVTTGPIPQINIDGCTINYGGTSAKYVLLDANTNPVNFTTQNSIIANTPKAGGTVATTLFRGTGTGTTMSFSYNNTFGLFTGAATPTPVTLPTSYAYLTATTNRTIDLGWTGATTDFKLPAGSELRTGGKTGGVIGDPRWAY
ncbi:MULTISPECIES: DUF4957 domain-containing protein [Niastella]|uniref:DUF4957 domain-containing protein n=1 Tax=Niastella soli TaxID=2821487 RepID=A0ABS3YLT2_9BACT|nr:DUF4957 domain-containing protein [Niastella soli]MBO9198793.1 DUF4957 domain-containing protein [Niastella soli]